MTDQQPVLWWVRRDLRLADNPALTAAVETGGPVIPVFIDDDVTRAQGSLPRWRLGLGAQAFDQALRARGSRLIVLRGDPAQILSQLCAETGARQVIWTRLFDPKIRDRDMGVKTALEGNGIRTRSLSGHVLFDPWRVETKTGGFYRVYSPYWRAVKDIDTGTMLPVPGQIPAPANWPESLPVEHLVDASTMHRAAAIVLPYLSVGEAKAHRRLHQFLQHKIGDYKRLRDVPSVDGTSRLSEHLTYGEISPRQCWLAGQRALTEGAPGAETFLKELAWREFAYHLLYHTPQITDQNWREGWDSFPWITDPSHPHVQAWQQGRTGIPFVDAAMRELYTTGHMHNRGRMIVGSYLCKHLMCHWKIGLNWFADCLSDWDPASNAMGWQWIAGSGPDAAPYFRIFNPVTQLQKFDPSDGYRNCWIAEGQSAPPATALDYFRAVPISWKLDPQALYPAPIVDLAEGRQIALTAYEQRQI